MIRFLSIFHSYRDAIEARIRAESELRAERCRAERAEARIVDLTDRLITDKNRIIDVLSRRSLGMNMFVDAEPPNAEMKPIEPRRIMARDLQKQKTDHFRQALKDYFDPEASAESNGAA